MTYRLMSRMFAVVSALALALAVPAFACDTCGSTTVSMPLQIIIKAQLNQRGEEESAQAIFMDQSAVQVDTDAAALYAIQNVPSNATIITLDTEQMDRASLPGDLKSMFDVVCPVDQNYAPSNRWGAYHGRYGNNGGLYGYGQRSHFGYSIRTPWFNASYGLNHNNQYYPYSHRPQYSRPYHYNGYNYYYYYPYCR